MDAQTSIDSWLQEEMGVEDTRRQGHAIAPRRHGNVPSGASTSTAADRLEWAARRSKSAS